MRGKCLIITLGLLCAIGLWGCSKTPVATGWETTDGGTYYRDAQGNPVTGWQEIEGQRYHFGEDGAMTTGWLELEGVRYYLSEDGTLTTGWLRLDGIAHFFDDTGAEVAGWVESRGMRYYLTDTGPLTGWQELEGKRYYFQENGALLTGWAEFSGALYFFDENGQPMSGWQELDGRRYCMDGDGKVLTGWQTLDGQRYHFSDRGAMTTGWYSEGGYDYYFRPDGTMATGPTEINGETRYFNANGIHIWLVNPWNPVPEGYTPDLVYIEDGYQMDSSCYDALVQMLSDCRAAGFEPKVVSGYRTHDVQVYLFEVKVEYYLDRGYDREDAEREAAKTIAVPGTSEHQLGLAIDILDADWNRMDDTQADTPTQQWLMAHCHEYGFILRYEQDTTDITGIIYEPWHYRYVGVEVAKEIVERGITLEEYLNAVVSE